MKHDSSPIQNPFAILNLSADASGRDIKSASKKALLRARLVKDDDQGGRARSNERAAELIKDPVSRYEHSIFWITLTGEQHKAWESNAILSSLGFEWNPKCIQEYETTIDSEDLGIRNHNMGVLHLGTAMHLSSTAASDHDDCKKMWKMAMKYWAMVISSSEFLKKMDERRRALNDPRLHDDYFSQWKADLPCCILGFIQEEASRLLMQQNVIAAKDYVGVISSSAFSESAINAALGNVYEPLCKLIDMEVKGFESRLDGSERKSTRDNGLFKIFNEFKAQTLPKLKDILSVGDLPGLQEERTRDNASRFLRNIAIAFVNELQKHKRSEEALKIAIQIADSASVKTQSEKTKQIVQANTHSNAAMELYKSGDLEGAIRALDEQLNSQELSAVVRGELKELRDKIASQYATELYNDAVSRIRQRNFKIALSLLERALQWETVHSEKRIIQDTIDKLQSHQRASKSACFVATATYGTPHHETVVQLRHYRDQVLLKSVPGRLFIRLYWIIGPWLALCIRHVPITRRIMAPLLSSIAGMLPDHSEGQI